MPEEFARSSTSASHQPRQDVLAGGQTRYRRHSRTSSIRAHLSPPRAAQRIATDCRQAQDSDVRVPTRTVRL
jgi:hypothetical protein